MGKVLRYIVIGLLVILILGGGALYLALKLNLFEFPKFVASIPVIGEKISEDKSTSASKKQEDPMEQENKKLIADLAEAQTENEKLKAELAQNEILMQALKDGEITFQEQIAALNLQILDLKTSRLGAKAAYKDMAAYYAEMKAKDAADILSKLNDDNVIGIIGEMDTDNAAKILQLMDHAQAARITQKMLVVSP